MKKEDTVKPGWLTVLHVVERMTRPPTFKSQAVAEHKERGVMSLIAAQEAELGSLTTGAGASPPPRAVNNKNV